MWYRRGLQMVLATVAGVGFAACVGSDTLSTDGAAGAGGTVSVGGTPGAGGATGGSLAAGGSVAGANKTCVVTTRIVGADGDQCLNGLNIQLNCPIGPGQSRPPCCPLVYPYYCSQTDTCYQNQAAAAAACGSTPCSSCVNLFGKCTQICLTGTLNIFDCTCPFPGPPASGGNVFPGPPGP